MTDRALGSFTVLFLPDNRKATVEAGRTVREAAEQAGIYLNSVCGGVGSCGKCGVVVREGRVESASDLGGGRVLACQARVAGDLCIEVPPETRLAGRPDAIGITPGSSREQSVFPLDPLCRKLFLALPRPGMDDRASDADRILREIGRRVTDPLLLDLDVLRGLPAVVRENDFKVTATLSRREPGIEITHLEPGDTSGKNYGIAIDIGTTTVVAELVDLSCGKALRRKASYNSQLRYGEDVIARILYTEEEHQGLEKLRELIVADVNGLIAEAVGESGIALSDVTYAVAAGNTVMTHILLGLAVSHIRREPYIPAANRFPVVPAAQTGIRICKSGLLYCLPCVGPFVGGDVTADVVSSGMHRSGELSLLFDLGTNGEVVLGNRDWLITCSASAGPAFEGGGLQCGMRAGEGAIERVAINPAGEIVTKVIGGSRPLGICGSGFIDLVAELFKAGYLDKSGRFIRDTGGPYMKNGEDGPRFVLAAEEKTENGKEISVGEEDLAVFIRSKGAVYTAAEALLARVGCAMRDVDRVFISGGFGSCVDVGNAVTVGLLPDLPVDRFTFIGNGSLAGARMCLSSVKALGDTEAAASRMTYFELSTDPKFMGDFTSSLFLPHTDLERFPSVVRALEGRGRTPNRASGRPVR